MVLLRTRKGQGSSLLSMKRRRKNSQQPKKNEPIVVQEHHLELKPFDLNSYINRKQDDQLMLQAIARKNAMGVQGRKDELLTEGQISTAELEFGAFLQSIQDQIIYPIESKCADLRMRHSLLVESYQEKTREERVADYLLQNSSRVNRRLRWILGRKNNQYTVQEQIELLAKAIEEELSEQADLIHRKYAQTIPKKHFLDYWLVYAVLMICISVAEWPINMSALQLMDISNGFVLILSACFSTIIGVSAHSLGQGIQQKNRWEAIAAASIGLSICGLVSILRSKLDDSVLMSFMNVLVFGFGAFLSYERSKNIAYWASVAKVKRLRRRKAKLQTMLRRSTNVLHAEAEKSVRTQVDDLKRFVDAGGTALSMIDSYKNQVIKRIEAIHNEGITMYRHANAQQHLKDTTPRMEIGQFSNT